jgi:hypothetical protein
VYRALWAANQSRSLLAFSVLQEHEQPGREVRRFRNAAERGVR